MRPGCYKQSYHVIWATARAMNQTKNNELPFDPKDFLSKANGARTVSKYAINQTIFHQGDPAVSIFYILTGKVKLTVTSDEGKEAVVAILGSDEFFGERCADGETLRLSAATALTECTITEITKAEFARIVHIEPAFAEFFISHLLTRSAHIRPRESMLNGSSFDNHRPTATLGL